MVCIFEKISFINTDKGICMFVQFKLLWCMVMGKELQLGKDLLINAIGYVNKSTQTQNMYCHVHIYLHSVRQI